eukprot:Selendium_serpulae@DN2752_c0_g1_i1.p1
MFFIVVDGVTSTIFKASIACGPRVLDNEFVRSMGRSVGGAIFRFNIYDDTGATFLLHNESCGSKTDLLLIFMCDLLTGKEEFFFVKSAQVGAFELVVAVDTLQYLQYLAAQHEPCYGLWTTNF